MQMIIMLLKKDCEDRKIVAQHLAEWLVGDFLRLVLVPGVYGDVFPHS